MYRLFIVFLSVLPLLTKAQPQKPEVPLVIGIVVDQMRYDYLNRYATHYSKNGFKRLMNQGSHFVYAQYNYIPTYTAPGHASIYTGSTPSHHGIISNHWYSKDEKKVVYCVTDARYETVGADNQSGECSPFRMQSTTLADAMRMHNNGRSRSFAVSLKDRGAVLPAGHMGNAAYWYDSKTGHFVSSTYYMMTLPTWLNAFNERQYADELMKDKWDLLLPRGYYENAFPDSGPGEEDVFREGETNFPHLFERLAPEDKRSAIRTTPFGNTLLTELAMELIDKESLGMRGYTDFLSISYSSPDYVGHAYGPNSMEVMDTYLRLDRELAFLMGYLDKTFGKANYLLFLTADHGVKPNGAYLDSNRIPAGSLSPSVVHDSLKAWSAMWYGDSTIIEAVHDNQVYFNKNQIARLKLDLNVLSLRFQAQLRDQFKTMSAVHSKQALNGFSAVRNMNHLALNGTHSYLSGDLSFELAPNFITGNHEKGTTHGAPFDYDTHVPLLFYGKTIPKDYRTEEVYIVDIAPTIAEILGIMEPESCIGQPLIPHPKR